MKKTYFILGSLATLALLVAGVASANAYSQNKNGENNSSEKMRGQGPEFNADFKDKMQTQRDEMDTLLKSGDYNAWKAYMDTKAEEVGHTPKMTETITADNFAKFVEMHNLMQSGDREGAQAIATELGIEQPGRGMGEMGGRGMHDRKFLDKNGDGVCDNLDLTETQE